VTLNAWPWSRYGRESEKAVRALFHTHFLEIKSANQTEHPPAAALALGLVLNEWSLLTLVVVIIGVVALSICKQLVLPILMDLL